MPRKTATPSTVFVAIVLGPPESVALPLSDPSGLGNPSAHVVVDKCPHDRWWEKCKLELIGNGACYMGNYAAKRGLRAPCNRCPRLQRKVVNARTCAGRRTCLACPVLNLGRRPAVQIALDALSELADIISHDENHTRTLMLLGRQHMSL